MFKPHFAMGQRKGEVDTGKLSIPHTEKSHECGS
jgi:hypothetical protein